RLSDSRPLETQTRRCADEDRERSEQLSRGALSRRVRARIEARRDPLMRIGVVGTGYLGRLHARILTEIPSITAAGFVDANDEIANEVSSSLGLERFDSVAQLAKEVDAAIVATPTTTHYDVARELLEAGIDVMIEKPVTRTVDEARRLIDL